MFKCFLYQIALFFLRIFPPEISYQCAAFISRLQYLCSFRDRRAVHDNLKNFTAPDADRSFLAKEVFRNMGRYLVEFFLMNEQVDQEFIAKKVHVKGQAHLDRVLERGQGGVLVTAHIGNWELGGVLLSVMGYPITAVALPHKERPVNDLFNRQREAKGVSVIPTSVALRRCIQQLRNNKLIALAADRDFGEHGLPMDFLGRTAMIPKGPAMFSLKTGAPIVPIFLTRNSDSTYNLTFYEPIIPPDRNSSAGGEGVVMDIIKKYIPAMEEQIRMNPSQWLLFKRFYVQ